MNSTKSIKPHCFIGRVGVAQADITPPLGIYSRCWGAANFDCASAVHREQKLSVFYMQADADPVLLINMELPWMDRASWDLMLQTASAAAGLEAHPESVVINMTHNHSSAPIEEIDPALEGALMINDYRDQVAQTLRDAVLQAQADCSDAVITADTGRCNLARNRDLKIEEDGPVFCGFNPEKEADDAVLVMRVTDAQTQAIKATLVNYACHPTTLAWDNVHLSPDYAGAMRALVEEFTNAPCCLFQGASGELSARHGHQEFTEVADKQGRQLGFAVLSCLEGMIDPAKQINFGGTIASGADLAYWAPGDLEVESRMHELRAEIIEFDLTLKDELPTVAEFQKLHDECDDRVMKERYRRRIKLRRSLGDGPLVKKSMWRFQIGGITLFASPFEWYSDFQIEVRAAFPGEQIAVCNLCNGSASYLVPENMYGEILYQKDICPFAKGSLEITIQAAKDSFLEPVTA